MNTYTHPQETWTEADCLKILKHKGGTPYSGLVTPSGSARPGYGQSQRYNGGCTREGEWYEGETIPLPIIPPGWEFYTRLSWGLYIRKIQTA